MGRRRQARLDLPPRVYLHHGSYRFVPRTGAPVNLGRDLGKALLAWAALAQPAAGIRTMGDLFDEYIKAELPALRARTREDYLACLRPLRIAFGTLAPASVTPVQVYAYLEARTARVRANRELAVLSGAFRLAVRRGVVAGNPTRDVRRNRERPRTRLPEFEEVEAFLLHAPRWLQLYVHLKLLVPLRQSDMLQLTRESYDHVIETGKTGVKLDIQGDERIAALLAELPASGPLFPVNKWGFSSAWRRATKKYVAAGGTAFREHDLRATVATEAERTGQDAQGLLGHASKRTTEAYIRAKGARRITPLKRTTK